ncbi:hypothetical protein, partial [Stenotrophomonas pavanii]|uniref:hypothetical protein n=1 Tax=Stenotrophomonas pavanii TaxID=487698 RepID=UPI0039C758DE
YHQPRTLNRPATESGGTSAERQGQPSRQPKAHKRVVTAAFGQALLEDADFIACVRQAVLQGEVEFHD